MGRSNKEERENSNVLKDKALRLFRGQGEHVDQTGIDPNKPKPKKKNRLDESEYE